MARFLRNDIVLDIQRRALQGGAEIRSKPGLSISRTVEWDVAGNCSAPVFVSLHGRPEDTTVVVPSNGSRFAELWVACRKCGNCLRRRSAMWRIRATAEIRYSVRTWFSTLTLRPEVYVHILSRARSRLAKAGTDYDALTFHDRFLEVEKEGFAEVQRMIKRLRKGGANLRYLAVSEAHKSGVPHWHLLIHEPDRPIRHKQLSGAWHWGFAKHKLVDHKAAAYCAKYLAKSVSARVRASSRYGRL